MFAISFLAWFSAAVLSLPISPEPGVTYELLRELGDWDDSRRAVVAQLLAERGVESLAVFYAGIESLPNMSLHYYRTMVVPKLPKEAAYAIFLDHFTQGLMIVGEVRSIMEREAQEKGTGDAEAAFEALEGPFRRWRWAIEAMGNLGCPAGYDHVYAVYIGYPPRLEPHFSFVQALKGMDPARAVADFETLLLSISDEQRIKGAWSFQQIAAAPPCEVLATLFQGGDSRLSEVAEQLLYHTGRDCLELLIDLSAHERARVARAAQHRLGNLSHLADRDIERAMGKRDSALEKREAWRIWWSERFQLNDEGLRQNALEQALQDAAISLDAKLVNFLASFPKAPQVYDCIREALWSSDPSTHKASVIVLGGLAASNHQEAIHIVLEFCDGHPLDESIQFAGTLGKSHDPRAVSVLLDMLGQVPESRRDWSISVLTALGDSGDERAIPPLLRWLTEKHDGSEQFAATVLPKLHGARNLQRELLDALLRQGNHNNRLAIRKVIREIGGPGLPALLTELLCQAGGGSLTAPGPQADILILMEEFPDQAARPLLLGLLKNGDRFARLHASRVLGRFGDYSGIPLLLDDLCMAQPVQYHDIGQALRDIQAPNTPHQLLSLFGRVDGQNRYRVLDVIGQQGSVEYLPFLEAQLNDADPKILHLAANGIAGLVISASEEGRRNRQPLTVPHLSAARTMLRWAFRDQRIRDTDRAFPDHSRLKSFVGAYLKRGEHGRLLYHAGQDALVLLDPNIAADAALIRTHESDPDETFGYGSLEWREHAGYLCISLGIDYGGASYLFRLVEGEWTPVCYLGGWIE